MNGLDKRGVEEMRQIFLNLKAEGTTILLASHNMEDIRCLCDKVYEMDAGVLTPIDEVSLMEGALQRAALFLLQKVLA